MFYDNLKAECERKGLKVTPTVKECGGSTGTINNWKKGGYPNSDIVMKLATRLNITTDILLFGNTKREIKEPEDEYRLIKAYRQLTDEGKDTILSTAELYASSPKYQKYTDVSKEA